MTKKELTAAVDRLEDKVETLEAELREARDLEAHWRKKHTDALALVEVERNKHRFFIQVIHALSEPRRD